MTREKLVEDGKLVLRAGVVMQCMGASLLGVILFLAQEMRQEVKSLTREVIALRTDMKRIELNSQQIRFLEHRVANLEDKK
mgnify:CR=1 FL=1